MKAFILTLFLTIGITQICAQHAQLDSLLNLYKNLPDTTRIKNLADYSWNNRAKNPQLALLCSQEALRLAELSDNRYYEAKSLNYMGVIYRNLGNYDLSIVMYKRALKLAEIVADSIQIAYAYNNIGGIHRLEGNNKTALEYIIRALKIFERRDFKEGIAFCTINIGLIYRRQQNYQKAIDYLNYTFEIRKKLNDKPGQALAIDLMAEVYFDMGNMDASLKNFFDAEKRYNELNDQKGLAAVWGGIGGVYFVKKDFKTAISYRERALELARKISYLEGMVLSYNNLGKIYAHMGQFAESYSYLEKALKIAGSMKEIYMQIDCFKYLSEYYSLKSEYKDALYYNEKFWALKDSVTKQETVSLLSELENLESNQKMETANSILQMENENHRRQELYLLIIVIIAIIFVVIIARYSISTKKLNVELQELNSIKDKFFRIIAHDLKNPFFTLLGFSESLETDFDILTKEEKLYYIKEMRLALKNNYNLLENLLFWANSQTKSLSFNPQNIFLNEVLKELLVLFAINAKTKNLIFLNSIDNNTAVQADPDMLKTILRNLISNAIKFSYHCGEIKFSAVTENNTTTISIEDFGIGMDAETINSLFALNKVSTLTGTDGEKGTGLGLVLCREFIELNRGKVFVESTPGKGSKVSFTLPAGN